MGIFKRFMNSLKKESISMEVVNPRDSLNIKDIETEEEKDLLNKYKKEYLAKLKGNVLSIIDLEIDELNKQMEMYTSLITEIILGLPKDAFLTQREKLDVQKDKTNLIIKARKLIMYLNDVSSIKRNAEIKLMALEEVNREHRIFNIFKRKTLQSKIISLFLSVYSLNSSEMGLTLESLACINEYKSLTEEDKKYLKSEEELISRKELLFEMVKKVLPLKIVKFNEETFESIYEEIAYLEYLLETEVYRNKEVLPILVEKIRRIDVRDEDSLNQIEDLELRLRIFYEFGKNLVIEEMFRELYEKKFLILTRDIMDYNKYKNSFASLNGVEQKYYEEIVARKLEVVFSKENSVLFKLLQNNVRKGMKIISKIFKSKESNNMLDDILNSRSRLAFLLSLERVETLEIFFKNYMVDKYNYILELDFDDSIFTWDGVIPYETVCRIAMCKGRIDDNPFYNFYDLIKKSNSKEKNVYYLPEGISGIRFDNLMDAVRESAILKSIQNNSRKATDIIMPSSLIHLNGIMEAFVAFGPTINNLVLNQGLFLIDKCSNYGGYNITNLWIPSSLRIISGDKNRSMKGVKNLVFSDHNVEEYRYALICVLELSFKFKNLENDNKELDSEQYVNLSGSDSLVDMKYSLDPVVDSLKFVNYGGSGLTISLDRSLLQNRFCVRKKNRKLSGKLYDKELNSLVTYIKDLVEKEYERQEKEIYNEGKKL